MCRIMINTRSTLSVIPWRWLWFGFLVLRVSIPGSSSSSAAAAAAAASSSLETMKHWNEMMLNVIKSSSTHCMSSSIVPRAGQHRAPNWCALPAVHSHPPIHAHPPHPLVPLPTHTLHTPPPTCTLPKPTPTTTIQTLIQTFPLFSPPAHTVTPLLTRFAGGMRVR